MSIRNAIDSREGREESVGEFRSEVLRAEEMLVGDVIAELLKTKAAYRTTNSEIAKFLDCSERHVENFFHGYVMTDEGKRSPTLHEVAQIAYCMDQQVRISLEYISGGYVRDERGRKSYE